MLRLAFLVIAIAACGLAPPRTLAQRVPFFSGAGTGFDPEISVVNSGEVLDAQAVVSNDLKYVTINTRASSSRLLALREFAFANRDNNRRALGFVGGAAGGGGGNAANQAARAANRGDANVLDRPGTTLVARLRD